MKCSTRKATTFTTTSIGLIQSASMREWASSARNLPLITEAAQAALTKNPKLSPQDWATYLTLLAMG